jgi:TPR repeat protein
MVALGDHFAGRGGAEPDHGTAHGWYVRAATLGHAGALTSLGVHHAEGRGTAQDAEEAVRIFQIAADAGVPEAMLNLAGLYREGRGVEKDSTEAAYWALNGASIAPNDIRKGAKAFARDLVKALPTAERRDVEERHARWREREVPKLREMTESSPRALAQEIARAYTAGPMHATARDE